MNAQTAIGYVLKQYAGISGDLESRGILGLDLPHVSIWFRETMLSEQVWVVVEGTHDILDAVRDFCALPFHPAKDTAFGHVHGGFALGMDHVARWVVEVWGKHAPGVTPHLYVTGHSLGAGGSAILAAYLKLYGVPPQYIHRVAFGEPRPGFPQLAAYLSDLAQNEIYQTVEGPKLSPDPVTEVPRCLGSVFNYVSSVHPRAPINLPVVVLPDDPWNIRVFGADILPLGRHHAELYAEAIGRQQGD